MLHSRIRRNSPDPTVRRITRVQNGGDQSPTRSCQCCLEETFVRTIEFQAHPIHSFASSRNSESQRQSQPVATQAIQVNPISRCVTVQAEAKWTTAPVLRELEVERPVADLDPGRASVSWAEARQCSGTWPILDTAQPSLLTPRDLSD